MKRTILLEGRQVTYELTRKRVKNINIRVRADGSVGVSAGRGVPLEYLEDLLRKRSGFILNALDQFSEREKRSPAAPTYDSGETIHFLGKPYTIDLQEGKHDRAELIGETLCLTLRHPEDGKAREAAVRAFQKELCLTVTTQLCRRFQPAMAHLGVPMPEIKVRSMTSRWGSCKPTDRRVTFALQLIRAPLPCVEYVVCHELVHFVHMNHSPAFYDCLAGFLPDWKQRRKMLNSYGEV